MGDAFVKARDDGDADAARKFLAEGADPDTLDDGFPVLYQAVAVCKSGSEGNEEVKSEPYIRIPSSGCSWLWIPDLEKSHELCATADWKFLCCSRV